MFSTNSKLIFGLVVAATTRFAQSTGVRTVNVSDACVALDGFEQIRISQDRGRVKHSFQQFIQNKLSRREFQITDLVKKISDGERGVLENDAKSEKSVVE